MVRAEKIQAESDGVERKPLGNMPNVSHAGNV